MTPSTETPRDRFIAALERRPPAGRVPTFELVFYLTMQAFGRVHPSHRDYRQWFQMEEHERQLHEPLGVEPRSATQGPCHHRDAVDVIRDRFWLRDAAVEPALARQVFQRADRVQELQHIEV